MSAKTIETLMDRLLEIEDEYEVFDWSVADMSIWPLIKHVAFFDFKDDKPTFRNQKEKPALLVRTIWKKVINRLKSKHVYNKSLKVDDIPHADILFAGANTYSVWWDNCHRNKFFDPIIDKIKFTSVYFNYSPYDLKNISRPDAAYNVHSFLKNMPENTHQIHTPNALDAFISSNQQAQIVMDRIVDALGVSKQLFLNALANQFRSVLGWKYIWSQIIDRVKPKLGMVLCYYDASMYGLISALKEKGIPSVDVQHGGQGTGHPAYSFSQKIQTDLNLLPDFFWVWEDSAKQNIDRWNSHVHHKAFVGGNPWIRLFAENKTPNPLFPDKKYILCTLPADKSYYNLTPESLFQAIRASGDEFVYGFRYHPKTTQAGKQMVRKSIKRENLDGKVDFIVANEQPMPYLLSKSWAHVSVGSLGSIAEATILGIKRNMILDKLGAKYYAKLIQDHKAFYFESDDGLLTFMQNIEISSDQGPAQFPEYNKLISDIIFD